MCINRFDVGHCFANNVQSNWVFTYGPEVFLVVFWCVVIFFIFGFNIHGIITYQWCACFSFWEIKNYMYWHIVNTILVDLIEQLYFYQHWCFDNNDNRNKILYLRYRYLGLYKCEETLSSVVLAFPSCVSEESTLFSVKYWQNPFTLLQISTFYGFITFSSSSWLTQLSLSNSTILVSFSLF